MRKSAVFWSTIFGLVAAVLLPINVQAASAGPGADVISAGEEHTCLVVSGGVKCVGANYSGQLGNGTLDDSFTAVDAIPAGSGATQVAAGGEHTCAIVLGGVQCWGANYDGQLGTGDLAGSLIPVVIIPAGSGVTAIANSYSHTCAVVSGGLKCWGANYQGQLGNGTKDSSTLPISVFPADSGVTSVGVGGNHTCAVVAGGIKCWGYNYYGQLGNGTQGNEFAEPLDIFPAGSNATSVSAFDMHTCAVIAGGVQCWGYGRNGQLGNGTDSPSSLPVTAISAGSGSTSVSAGSSHTCAVVSGAVQCWGYNWAGQIGNGTSSYRQAVTSPQVVIDSQTGAKSVSAGGSHTCAILNSGFVKCWGYNFSGQLGVGYGAYSTTPISTIPEGSGVTAIDAGDNHVCVLVDGGVKCWGGNDSGQLGNGTTDSSVEPVIAIPSGSGVTSISSGYKFTCAVVMGGVKCWGNNITGQLGNGTSDNSADPVWTIPQGSEATSVSTSNSHACATVNGGVQCWGDNNYGQLGTGDRLPSFTPITAIEADSFFSRVAVGGMHTCAAWSNTVLVKCWGANMFGQIGDSGGDGSNSPVVVALPPGMSASRVATGYGHTCATVNAGVYCWGSNYNGQIGSGIDSASVAPTPVSAIEPDSGATDVSLGEAHSCALISGAVQCWGDNDLGQLGNGTKQTAKLAVPVSLLGANVTGISAGGFFTCAVVGGGVKCWGTGEEGQLGYDADSNLPIDASSFGLALTQKFKVTYVAPGIKSQLPTQADVEEGTTFELAGAPVRSGYKFAGWSDGTQVYAAGATYPADSVTGDLQLTATWTSIKPTTNKKLTYNVVGFAAGTSKLTKSMMLTLNAVAKFASSGAQVTCTGYTGGPSVLAIDKYIALNRATVVCNYLAKKNPKLANFKVKTVNTKIVSSDQRKTVVTLSK